jgi:hypothetical protein
MAAPEITAQDILECLRYGILLLLGVPVPPKPVVLSVSFAPIPQEKGSLSMAQALQGTITLSAPAASPSISKRTVSLVINGGTPSSLDASSGSATFTCNDGDTVSVTDVDTSTGGVSSAPSAAVTVIAHDTVSVPATPSVVGISFAPVPPAAATPAPAGGAAAPSTRYGSSI